MGKKGNWFSAVKKALSPESKGKKYEKTDKPKKRWFGKHKNQNHASLSEDVRLSEAEDKQSKHAYSVAIATAVAAEVAVAAAQAAAEVVRLTSVSHLSGNSKEEIAAIRIQTAFRGYLARRALQSLRGLVRLKSLVQGQSVKQQTTSTLRCMQNLARVQSQLRARRIRMSEENQALQRQIQQKHEKELEKLRASTGEEWDDRIHSKEKVEANLLGKQEAAIRRERASAYAYSHQQMSKNTRSANPTFMDPNNPHWGWSWLERWMAARPWESRTTGEYNNHTNIKSTKTNPMSIVEISKANYRHGLINGQKSSGPPSCQSPATPPSKAPDSRSMLSFQSERYGRHSIAGSSVRDDESLFSSPSIPSYMAPTKSAKAKSRMPSPLGSDPDKELVGSAKKRLSFSCSPTAPRRHSGPPKASRKL